MTTPKDEDATKRISRLEVAKWAIGALADKVKAAGVYQAALTRCPAYWSSRDGGCKLALTPGVLRSPDDPALSALLDVWLDGSGKVLSVSWFPEKPWIPPNITTLKRGDWMCRLGWQP
jgi:hypothetical protein